MRAPRAVLAVCCSALVLAGCSLAPAAEPQGGEPTTVPSPSGPVDAPSEQAADPANARFYDQDLAWSACGDGLECATATVPVDWAAPAAATLELALARRPATDPDARLGALLVNPGGPGGSGVDWVRGSPVVSADLASRYDVVGFDPRGVGASDPVDCLSDPELDAYLSADGPDPEAPGGLDALRAYVEDCPARRDCPLAEDPEAALAQVRGVVDAADAAPLPTGGDRPLTAALATTGIITPLYEDASWPLLDRALEGGLGGEGELLLQLADAYADRREDGSYGSNLLEVFTAVNCLDYPVEDDPERLRATAAALERASPTLGESMAYGEVQCAVWPVPPTREPGPITAEGAAPILVVGTTGDPATPYAWSRALADQLSSGSLLTWEGEGHTAYGRGSGCVDAAVDGWFLDGVLPGEGATCPA